MQQQIESMQGKVDYELVSICNHYGEIDSGHYIGVCKRGSEWIIFDDEQYSQTENLHVIATKADFIWICNVLPQMLGQLGVCFPELALDALERTIEFHKAMNNALFFLFGEHLCSKISTAFFEALSKIQAEGLVRAKTVYGLEKLQNFKTEPGHGYAESSLASILAVGF
jgi:hypothetical protein